MNIAYKRGPAETKISKRHEQKVFITQVQKYLNLNIQWLAIIYFAKSVLFLLFIKASFINAGTVFANFIVQWQKFFNPLMMRLLENQSIVSLPQFVSSDIVLSISQLSWEWLVGFLLIYTTIEFLVITGLATSINIFAQKIFLLTSKFKSVLKKSLIILITVSIFGGFIIGGIIYFSSSENIFLLKKLFIFLGVAASLWFIYEIISAYNTDWKKAMILFLLVFAFFPVAIMLMLVYALVELPFMKKSAAIIERTVRVWVELIYLPNQALTQISAGLSLAIICVFAVFSGLTGISIIYLYPKIAQFNTIYEPLAQGFLLLFYKLEMVSIWIMGDLSFTPFANVTFNTPIYIYLFALFMTSFLLQAVLIDYTAWMAFGYNKNFKATLFALMAITTIAIVCFLGLTFIALMAGYFIQIVAGLPNPGVLAKGLALILTIGFLLTVNLFYYPRAFGIIYGTDPNRGFMLWLVSFMLFPISVLILLANSVLELVSPLLVPWQKKILKASIKELTAIHSETSYESVTRAIEKFSRNLKARSNYNVIARRHIDMEPALTAMIEHRPKVIIINLLSMADSKDPELSMDAVKWLATIFKISAKSHIRLFYYMLEHQLRPNLVKRLADHVANNPATATWHQIFTRYYQLMDTQSFTDRHKAIMMELSQLYEKLNTDHLSTEFSLIYKTLGTIASAKSISEITRCNDPITDYLQLPSPEENDLLNIFKLFLRLSNYQDLFERLEEENKITFVTMQLALLVDIQRDIASLKNRDLERRLLQQMANRLQNWAMLQSAQLRGTIELVVDLRTERIPAHEENSVIVVNVHNAGTALAQNIRLTLGVQETDFFKVAGNTSRTVPLLEPKANHLFEYVISPLKPGAQRLVFRGSYMDMDKKEVPFEYADILHFVEKETVDNREYEIGEVINPYIAGTAVAEPKMFFGRQQEFRNIRDNMEGRFRDNIIVLHGQRRTGKSSMLLQMQNHLGGEKYICVFINLEGIISSGLQNFLFQFSTLAARQLEKMGIKIERPMLNDFAKEPAFFFRDQFLPSIYQKIGSRKLLLMLDEFEQIEKRVEDGKLDRDIFPFLRDLMQHSENLSFIMAGAHKLNEMRSDYWNILFNITRYVKIGFLDKESSIRLICEPVDNYVTYDQFAIEKIYRITAGQPYFIQLICHELFNRYRREKKNYITVKDVNAAVHDVIIAGSGHLDYIWSTSNWMERIIMSSIADIAMYDDDRVRLSAIGSRLKDLHFNLDENQSRVALNRLVDLEILSSDSHFDSFAFRVDLVREWLKEKHQIGKSIEEYMLTIR